MRSSTSRNSSMSPDPVTTSPHSGVCPGCAPSTATRREFLTRSSLGFGWLAFLGLGQQWAAAESRRPGAHFAPRAKRVIFLFMDGGPSHVDTFDPKPELAKQDGQPAKWHADVKS